jgi:hypothetical protein
MDPDDLVTDESDPYADAPWICPGCYCSASEPHAGYCPDAAIEARHEEEALERDLYGDPDEEDEGCE